jgi:hypothetical protein
MRTVLIVWLFGLWSCGAAVEPEVTVMERPAERDAGAIPLDAGTVLESHDAGVPEPDAGESTDAGEPADAGDAGRPLDAGVRRDAGVPQGDAGTSWPNPGPFTAGARLYTSDGQAFTVDRLGDALDHALTPPAPRHVIFYVHGRACGGGGEPQKSLGDAIPELKANQN